MPACGCYERQVGHYNQNLDVWLTENLILHIFLLGNFFVLVIQFFI
jgi:hypothetical protein